MKNIRILMTTVLLLAAVSVDVQADEHRARNARSSQSGDQPVIERARHLRDGVALHATFRGGPNSRSTGGMPSFANSARDA